MEDFYIEETIRGGEGEDKISYGIIWRGSDIEDALNKLKELNITNKNRLELWIKGWSSTEKGFAPLAYADKNGMRVSHSCEFLFRH